MKQLNIGIIGAGRIGKVHAQSITYNVPTAKVLGITDVFKDGLQELADKYGIEKVYNDYKEMLADEEIDAVVEDITRSLMRDFDKEVPSLEIGERVMDALRDLDQVAYVRFASVYRKFQAAKDFISEVKHLKK